MYVAATARGLTYSTKNFSYLISAVPDDALHKSTDVNLGWGSAIGLPWPISSTGDVITYCYNSAYATTADYAVDATYDRVRPKTLAADAKLLFIYKSTWQ